MKIVVANNSDFGYIRECDHHIFQGLILQKIKENEIYIMRDEDENNIGWMRYGYFWDNTPFMNMIWVEEQYRGQGLGKQVSTES